MCVYNVSGNFDQSSYMVFDFTDICGKFQILNVI